MGHEAQRVDSFLLSVGLKSPNSISYRLSRIVLRPVRRPFLDYSPWMRDGTVEGTEGSDEYDLTETQNGRENLDCSLVLKR